MYRNNRGGQEMQHDGNGLIYPRAPAAGPTWVGKRRRRRVDGMLVIDFEKPGRHVSRPSDAEIALEYATYVDVNPPKRGSRQGGDADSGAQRTLCCLLHSNITNDMQASTPSLKASTSVCIVCICPLSQCQCTEIADCKHPKRGSMRPGAHHSCLIFAFSFSCITRFACTSVRT